MKVTNRWPPSPKMPIPKPATVSDALLPASACRRQRPDWSVQSLSALAGLRSILLQATGIGWEVTVGPGG